MMRKNGSVPIGNTEMYYAAFGNGQRHLVVLPGLSDGPDPGLDVGG